MSCSPCPPVYKQLTVSGMLYWSNFNYSLFWSPWISFTLWFVPPESQLLCALVRPRTHQLYGLVPLNHIYIFVCSLWIWSILRFQPPESQLLCGSVPPGTHQLYGLVPLNRIYTVVWSLWIPTTLLFGPSDSQLLCTSAPLNFMYSMVWVPWISSTFWFHASASYVLSRLISLLSGYTHLASCGTRGDSSGKLCESVACQCRTFSLDAAMASSVRFMA
jgi:hypothetical protein